MRDSVSGTAFGRERCMLQTSCFRRRSHFRNSGFALNMSVVAKQQKQNKTRDSSVAFLRSAAVVLRKAARAGVWRLAFSFFFFFACARASHERFLEGHLSTALSPAQRPDGVCDERGDGCSCFCWERRKRCPCRSGGRRRTWGLELARTSCASR